MSKEIINQLIYPLAESPLIQEITNQIVINHLNTRVDYLLDTGYESPKQLHKATVDGLTRQEIMHTVDDFLADLRTVISNRLGNTMPTVTFENIQFDDQLNIEHVDIKVS